MEARDRKPLDRMIQVRLIPVPLPFRIPAMSPHWALTSLTRPRLGIPARALWGRACIPATRASPRKYSKASPEADSDPGSRVLTDPERPDLFYHLLEPPSAVSATNYVFGLSFLKTLKLKGDGGFPQIIGYLPASEGGDAIEAGLNDFRENRKSASTSSDTHC